MRQALVLAMLLLTACPGPEGDGEVDGGFNLFLTRKSFTKRFQDKFCDELFQCSRGQFTCDEIGMTTGTNGMESCDFDGGRARECLNGEWICEQDFGFPSPPIECGEVFTNCGRGTFTTTTVDF